MVKILICTFVLRSQHSSYGNPETLFLAIKKQMFTKGKTALPTKIENADIKLKNWKPNPDRANQAASGSHCSLLVECKAVSQLLLELFAPFLEQMCDFVGDSFATSLIFCLGMGDILCTKQFTEGDHFHFLSVIPIFYFYSLTCHK